MSDVPAWVRALAEAAVDGLGDVFYDPREGPYDLEVPYAGYPGDDAKERQYHWAIATVAESMASALRSDAPLVRISVAGGVAYLEAKPAGVTVEIVDYDDEPASVGRWGPDAEVKALVE